MEPVKKHSFAENPLIYLLQMTWHYSNSNRKNVITYWCMFIMSNAIDLFGKPLMLAGVIKIVAENGITKDTMMSRLLLFLGGYFLCSVASWAFHGPARVIERTNAFKIRANYKKYLMNGVMNLPIQWHVDHHSGDTIDKIEKGTDSMYGFSSTVFIIIGGFLNSLEVI